MSRNRVVLAIVIASDACAGATTRAREASCILAPADSMYLARGPVYRDCAVDRRARLLTTNGRPQFQPPTPPLAGTACYSAQIEVVVDSAGVPELETVRVVRANDPAFADAVLASLPRWRYQPALKSGVAVRQVVRETQTIAVEVVLVRAGETPRPRRALPC